MRTRQWFILTVTALSLLALSVSAMAASTGVPLPPGAMEVEVFYWDGTNWVSMGTGNDSAMARSWNSLPVNSGGYSNKQFHTITFVNHASVAQWIDWTITGTRKDWRVRQPGMYASDSLTFTIKSNNDVLVDFEDFADLLYEDPGSAPPGTQTEIETWYSYGATIAEAEANGWWRAADLNDADFTFFNSNPLHYGLTYKLWSKILVEESNNSSEYEDQGLVTLTLTNIKHWIDPSTGLFATPQS